jgi:predicted nucleic acid-binding Zn ribbon protein
MRRKNTELLGDVIQQFLKQRKLDKPLYEQRLLNAWPEVLGPNIQSYTSSLSIKNKVLYVSISSSVLRHDLFLSRQQIVESLNKHVGAEVIKEIVFR